MKKALKRGDLEPRLDFVTSLSDVITSEAEGRASFR